MKGGLCCLAAPLKAMDLVIPLHRVVHLIDRVGDFSGLLGGYYAAAYIPSNQSSKPVRNTFYSHTYQGYEATASGGQGNTFIRTR